ncbi:MAG TPA: ATP-binding cassette domain-containing protein [Thiotrichales bacterium]|nr:ATP-binding cassette domain-containing protein [Thiotrichales bacterium]
MEKLVIRANGVELWQTWLDRPECTLGRLAGCEVRLDHRSASRRHARIVQVPEGWVLEDLGSTNGTFVNGRQIERHLLRAGDRIGIGEYEILFVEGEGDSAIPLTLPVVLVTGVTKTYTLGEQRVPALRGVSLSVQKGEFLAIAGPSGSGKSTLLNIIGCIDTPSSGTVSIEGESVKGDPDTLADLRARTIGFVFQTFNLLPVLSARENVEFPLLNRPDVAPAERAKRVEHYLQMVGLGRYADHRPNQLSGGQRQRVAIARALVTHPSIVLADEPTANLDHATGETVLQLMRDINRQEGVTFIFSTHDQRVMELADRVVRIFDGRIET